jgi:hypothetical protein
VQPSPVWDKWISPATLLGWVRNTAPFLFEGPRHEAAGRLIGLGGGPDGFLRILHSAANLQAPDLAAGEQLQDYFALCLAAHHATVATFVPTDVDSKIRGLLWRESRDAQVLRPMLDLAIESMGWDQSGISRRVVRGVSGHNGEQLSVLAGAHDRFLETGDGEYALKSAWAIEEEVRREAFVFEETTDEIELLLLAMTLAHNRGDLNQGMSYWRKSEAAQAARRRFEEMARFPAALRMYQQTGMAAEGHRHYPLRSVKGLRRSPELLLPLPPILDDWGAAAIRIEERGEVLEALISGCRKIEGQQGYFRAIAGMQTAAPQLFERAVAALPNAARKELRDSEFRKKLDVPRASFESMMRKRARTALGAVRA